MPKLLKQIDNHQKQIKKVSHYYFYIMPWHSFFTCLCMMLHNRQSKWSYKGNTARISKAKSLPNHLTTTRLHSLTSNKSYTQTNWIISPTTCKGISNCGVIPHLHQVQTSMCTCLHTFYARHIFNYVKSVCTLHFLLFLHW